MPAEHTSWASGDGRTISVSLYCIRMMIVVQRRWSYNQCELVLHQDDDCGPGVILAAAGAVYKKESDLEELCTDPESQVCELSNTALPITHLTHSMLAINVCAVCINTLQFIHIRQHAYGA